jgi:3-hydroxybutyryl-CoA dehydrogenase
MGTINVRTIAVIGAGTMGAGIAQLAAQHGCAVHLIDVSPDVVDKAMAGLRQTLGRLVDREKITSADRDAALANLRPSSKIEDLHDVDLAIEAVVENLDIKQRVFLALQAACRPEAVLATNTSSLPVTKIAASLGDPRRMIGMHFFNPAPLMPLVEIIATAHSDPTAIETGLAAARGWGKTTVRAADTPGFIVNRVARGYYLEAMRLLGEGVAGVDEIDGIMRTHGKFRMGPFELMDLVGLDVNLAVSTSVWEQLSRPARLAPHEIQRQLVESGRLGRKSGRGFYDYGATHPIPAVPVDRRSFALTPLLSDALLAFCARAGAPQATSTEQYVFARILAAIMNEAHLAFDDGVASSDDIDTAMTKGTNYPRGPLAWSDEVGARSVAGVLRALNDTTTDGRYEPAAGLRDA